MARCIDAGSRCAAYLTSTQTLPTERRTTKSPLRLQPGRASKTKNNMTKKAEAAVSVKDDGQNAKSVPPTRAPKKTEMSLRVEYTRDEIVDLARKQAEAYGELSRAEDEKKAVVATLKAKCDGISARIAELAGKITAGFEYRTVPCEIRYDEPKAGLKTTLRLDMGTEVNVEPMTLSERQAELQLDAPKPVQPQPVTVSFKIEDFDNFSECQLYPEGYDASDEEVDEFASDLRVAFVYDDYRGEMATSEQRLSYVKNTVNDEGAAYAERWMKWLRAARSEPLPGSDLLANEIEAVLRDEKEKRGIAAAKKPKGRKVTSGTVEVPSDEGSRDDAGEDSKNNL